MSRPDNFFSTEETTYALYREKTSEGNVIAIDLNASEVWADLNGWQGYAALHERPNSPVTWTTGHNCTLGERISEEEAREVHSLLFKRLDRDETRDDVYFE
ncbi:hypothetical protein [Salinibacter phage M8CC-19]|uniref:Uncharacterized protein n=2 Tax=Kryptosalinivirus M8CC19 TaxID=2560720 RepID=A0A2I6UGA7_9CAUD|nr:hypothetical protein FGG63_gp61 [Salinibacter phage M8CC-19]AUO79000.1 hypothetical protein [Salinibacter phage M8CC-19]AUO79233.1 hypothetical protein [Salinibacter phage M31CC-1]